MLVFVPKKLHNAAKSELFSFFDSVTKPAPSLATFVSVTAVELVGLFFLWWFVGVAFCCGGKLLMMGMVCWFLVLLSVWCFSLAAVLHGSKNIAGFVCSSVVAGVFWAGFCANLGVVVLVGAWVGVGVSLCANAITLQKLFWAHLH